VVLDRQSDGRDVGHRGGILRKGRSGGEEEEQGRETCSNLNWKEASKRARAYFISERREGE
jgi:hypothetical protein